MASVHHWIHWEVTFPRDSTHHQLVTTGHWLSGRCQTWPGQLIYRNSLETQEKFTAWWWLEHGWMMTFQKQLGSWEWDFWYILIIPCLTNEDIFFRGVGQPPSSNDLRSILLKNPSTREIHTTGTGHVRHVRFKKQFLELGTCIFDCFWQVISSFVTSVNLMSLGKGWSHNFVISLWPSWAIHMLRKWIVSFVHVFRIVNCILCVLYITMADHLLSQFFMSLQFDIESHQILLPSGNLT